MDHTMPGSESTTAPEVLEPLDDWIHAQPSSADERAGRIHLPASVSDARLKRSMVLAVGSAVTDLHPGDVVLVLSTKVIEMRDGSMLVQRPHVVARLQG